MKLIHLLTFVVTVSVVGRCLADDGPDWAGMAVAGASMAKEILEQGAGVQSSFKVKMGK